MLPNNAVQAAQQLICPYLAKASVVVDATAGNGNDTLFLARYTPPEATVWAFDIQPTAIETTRSLLFSQGLLGKVRLTQDSHDQINRYTRYPLDAAMFNLGYLPGSDHKLATQPETTLVAVRQVAELLSLGGMMTIVVYPGHASGYSENEMLVSALSALPQKRYAVLCWKMINQINDPPLLYAVERRS